MKLSEAITQTTQTGDDWNIRDLTEFLKELNKMGLLRRNVEEGRATVIQRNPIGMSLPQQEPQPLQKDVQSQLPPSNEQQNLDVQNVNDEKLDNELMKLLNIYAENPLVSRFTVGDAINQLRENKEYRAELIRIVKEAFRRASK